ncbi:aspartate dehydrogenase [Pseudorhodobacter sp.]|uniref:aspartate dehydrogenase n=1 Tax=Pseudorhodobacter sp. TaxID=1934400 RepID=UPI00264A007F|nr:aspartate dehydrogenase [Pseudorhodobacter sp.]MDN5786737.1 aspartate dehydrogenase [Pseudorhodobacter sp.]
MSDFDLRVVLVGWGAIATRVAALLAERRSPVSIVAVAVRDTATPRQGLPEGVLLIRDPSELAAVEADLMVEAAGRGSVAPWARAGLARGLDVAISSTSALTDAALFAELTGLARENRAQLLIPPGALGGIDALAAAARLDMQSVRHEVVKPAGAWAGTKAETLCDLAALTAPFTFFEGTARQAADDYPQNANVAVISALAGIGLERTTVALTADPGAKLNSHRIRAMGDFGTLTLTLENRPLATNPKSSEMTALSLLRMIENRINPMVI